MAPVTVLPTLDLREPAPASTCALRACAKGTRVTVVDLECSGDEACRLRALGFCEGTSVRVIDDRDAMVLDVRGTRLALGSALAAGITVQPAPPRL